MDTSIVNTCSGVLYFDRDTFRKNCIADAMVYVIFNYQFSNYMRFFIRAELCVRMHYALQLTFTIIQMTHSLKWAKLRIEALKQNCIAHILHNQPIPNGVLKNATAPLLARKVTHSPTQTATTNHYTLKQDPANFTYELLESLENIGCVNDCNGNGKCQNGMNVNVSVK